MKEIISVFIASPNDLSSERRIFKDIIDELNSGFGDGAEVEFKPLGWEDTFASTGRRTQGVINREIDKCDIFILVMFRRWGQMAPDAEPYSSYTEEEFHRALERFKETESPEIFVFFKRVDPASEADPGPQLKKVMEFRKHLEETRQVLYHYFDDKQSFINEIDTHLRAFVKGDLLKPDYQFEKIVLPLSALKEVKQAKEEIERKIAKIEKAEDKAQKALLKIEEMQLRSAIEASILSKDGKIEFARQKFSQLISDTNDTRILRLAYEFYERSSDLKTALAILENWLNLVGPNQINIETSEVYIKRGHIYSTLSELKKAEKEYQNALKIVESLRDKKMMADVYCSLGNLYRKRGDLNSAEKLLKKSFNYIKNLDNKDLMSTIACSLGLLYKMTGKLELAEKMLKKATSKEVKDKYLTEYVTAYSNLGNLHHMKGNYELAKKIYLESLSINKKIERKLGMAVNFGNLGGMAMQKSDFKAAEKMLKKSLSIYKEIGDKVNISCIQINLGMVHFYKKELDLAEKFCSDALFNAEFSGNKEALANAIGHLGYIYSNQGKIALAKEKLSKSKILFQELKSPKVNTIDQWLNKLQ